MGRGAGYLTNRRWDYGILVPGIDYTQPAPVVVPPPKTIIYRYTNPMMVAAKIGEIQHALTNAGFSTKGADDIFGINTRNAVMAFQRSKGLTIDGEVGPDTAKALGVGL